MTMIWSDDPVADAERYFAERDREETRLPSCCCCSDPIQDEHLYNFNGDLVCEYCVEDYLWEYKDQFKEEASKHIREVYI